MNVLDLASGKVKLKKVSGTHGGEWQGPCPGCGGKDRFHVWPEQDDGRGGYWCRSCEKAGDNIQFLRDFEGLSFKDACARLRISLPERSQSPQQATPRTTPVFEPEKRIPPAGAWQERAENFLLWSQRHLENNETVLAWLSMATMVVERARRAFVVVESELDAIAVASAGLTAGAVALGSLGAKPDAVAYAILREALQILNALDYGDTGGGAKAAARAMEWWSEHFERCDRWPVPRGKDPGEAIRMGTDLEKWIRAGMPPALTMDSGRASRILLPPSKDALQAATVVPESHAMPDLPAAVGELLALLKKNPSVKIINTKTRFTVLRDGKYVGGRINELVFRFPDVTDYIAKHPAEEIDGENLILP